MVLGSLQSRYSRIDFAEKLSAHFTPSDIIRTPTKLFGRGGMLQDIERAFQSPGRHVFIYGDRGVGKSSVAETAAYMLTAHGDPIVVQCTRQSTLFGTIRDIAGTVYSRKDRFNPKKQGRGVQLSIPGIGGIGTNTSPQESSELPSPKSLNDCFELLRFVCEKRDGQIVVVLDEFDNIEDQSSVSDFAEFMKGLPSISDTKLKFIFCGIFRSLEDLMRQHPSIGRQFETVYLEPVSLGTLFNIINPAAAEFNIEVADPFLIRIAVLSDQFPHFVHLFGLYLFWHLFDINFHDDAIDRPHYKHAVRATLTKAEAEGTVQNVGCGHWFFRQGFC